MASINAGQETGDHPNVTWGELVATVDFSTTVALDVRNHFELECARVRSELQGALATGERLFERPDVRGALRTRFYISRVVERVIEPPTAHQVILPLANMISASAPVHDAHIRLHDAVQAAHVPPDGSPEADWLRKSLGGRHVVNPEVIPPLPSAEVIGFPAGISAGDVMNGSQPVPSIAAE